MRPPGRSTVVRRPEPWTFASTTAMYGRKIAPAANTASHQPRAKSRPMTQSTRIDIAIEYLIMRDRRSASGESGSVVIDCCCFMVVAVVLRHSSCFKPTSDSG